MWRFLCRRLFHAAIVTVGVVSVVFLLIHIVPGDPVEVMLGESAVAAERTALRHALGLDQPLAVQWLHYLCGLLRFDMGSSLYSRRAIFDVLCERLPATVILAAAAMIVALIISVPLGIFSARRPGRSFDLCSAGYAAMAAAVPSFWLGPMLVWVFALQLGWFPVSGREGGASLVLPALTLGVGLSVPLMRILRGSLLEVAQEDFLRAARARGLPPRVLFLHYALRNAALPALTVFGLQLGALLGGAVITETIFQWPGVGLLTVEAILRRDYPMLQGCVLLIAVIYVGVNMLVDLAHGALDERVRASS
ncbi:MAG TPA: ABC transporter permease [Gammaproteobacteria bacterium]|nr:ABC transporter permease [Gammaproteobacteria bacterium]